MYLPAVTCWRLAFSGGNLPAPAESMVSAVWINKERRHSLTPEEVAPEAEETLEEDDRGCLQTPESPWHTHLEMHRLVQTFHQGTSLHIRHKDKFMGSEPRLPGLFEDTQMTQQETTIPETAQPECQADESQTKTVGSGFHVGTQGPPAINRPHRAGKPAHYPFPQRKTPRISQAARNLGLYGPA